MTKVTAKRNNSLRFGVLRISGTLVLMLLLAALLVACGGNEGGNGEGVGGDKANRGGGRGGGAAEEPPITELSEIISASDREALAGRRVRLAEVNVLELVNNRSMFVGANEAESLFVAVRRVPRVGGTTGGIEEQTREQRARQRFEEGQTIEVAGVIRPVPETADQALRRFGLQGEQFELVQEEEVFIRARRAEIVGGG